MERKTEELALCSSSGSMQMYASHGSSGNDHFCSEVFPFYGPKNLVL